jgi:hypothetical protein
MKHLGWRSEKFKTAVVISGRLNTFQFYRRLRQLATYKRTTRAELSGPLQLVEGVQGIRIGTLESGQASQQENKGKKVFAACLFSFRSFVTGKTRLIWSSQSQLLGEEWCKKSAIENAESSTKLGKGRDVGSRFGVVLCRIEIKQ